MEELAAELNQEIMKLANQVKELKDQIKQLEQTKHKSLQHMAETAQVEKANAMELLQKESEYKIKNSDSNNNDGNKVENMLEANRKLEEAQAKETKLLEDARMKWNKEKQEIIYNVID